MASCLKVKQRKMEGTVIKCSGCQQEIRVTSKAMSVRCRCSTLFKSKSTQQSSGQQHRHDSSFPVGSLGMMMKSKSFDSPAEACQRKKALICGVTYSKFKYKLKGSAHDVDCMKSLLIEHFQFPIESIVTLKEELNDDNLIPTKKNMQKALKWLVKGCRPGDSLVFYFSGHGLRQPDFNDDELDGFDETLCPVDFKNAGMILDNDINTTIVKPLQQGVTLHAIIDACHSGTILDLEHVYSRKGRRWLDNRPPSGANKSTSGGLAISFSACADDQMAADTDAFTQGKQMAGAMTYNFIQAVKTIRNITYGRLLDYMHEKLISATKTRCLNSRRLNRLFRRNLMQDPQLSASEEFDVYEKQFKL